MRIFWLGLAVIFVAALLLGRSGEDLPGFLLVMATALLPSLLWCSRAAHGIPIYPLFALGTIWTFGLPLIAQHPAAMPYGASARLAAAATVGMVNLAGCATWYLFTRRISPQPRRYLGFRIRSGDALFFAALLTDVTFNVITSSVDLQLDPAIFSILRATVQALANLAIFVLGYRAGQRELSRGRSRFYVIVMVLVVASSLPSVLMVNALSNGALALVAFALGRGRLPGAALLLFLGAALFLQAGKSSMREKYWAGAEGAPISFAHFPEFMDDWIGFSWQEIVASPPLRGKTNAGEVEPQSLAERASLLHLFLLIQHMSPAETPFLRGATYAIIPRLLIPRLLDEGKARAHLGTYLLAIHYDLQRPEDTSMTTIGFGLINEAMANFGYLGCLGLGTFLGLFYGWAGRWSSSHPLLSLRALFSILILTVSFENEFTAGVYVTVLFQGACALGLLALLTMRLVSVRGVVHHTPALAGQRGELAPLPFLPHTLAR